MSDAVADTTEDAILEAIERCDEGTADRADRSLAAAAMVRQAYAYAGLDAWRFSRWLKAIADEFDQAPDRPLH